MTDQLVTRFNMGQDVPEWLMVAEPEQAGAPKGHFRFCADVDVVDLPNMYLVVPNVAFHPNGGPVIDNVGMAGHRVMAASKPVTLVLGGAVFYGPETTPLFREAEARLREQQERQYLAQAIRQDPGVIVVPDPHRTFWQRVVYAFRGR